MKATGVSMSDIARKCNISRQAVRYWFEHGDMKLSQAVSIMESFNCRIRFYYFNQDTQESFTPSEAQIIPIDKSLFPKAGKMMYVSFIHSALQSTSKSMQTIAKEIGISNSTFTYMWNKDDVKLSILYKIGDALDLSTKFEIQIGDTILSDSI